MSTQTPEKRPAVQGTNVYVDLRGQPYPLADLDGEERALFDELVALYESQPDWNDFCNRRTAKLAQLYDSRGVPRAKSRRTFLFRITQDLASRLAVAQGYARLPDYRDDLAVLIQREFKSRREFCRETGISEDMLSHVLARRKHLSIESLTDALARIGYTLQIMPSEALEATDH